MNQRQITFVSSEIRGMKNNLHMCVGQIELDNVEAKLNTHCHCFKGKAFLFLCSFPFTVNSNESIIVS